jgi:DNA-binding PadR family transcriptional regulator
MRKLEREGLIERHVLGNGKLVARITNSGRKSLDFLFAE